MVVMQTVVFFRTFERGATRCKLSEAEVFRLVTYLAANPTAGDEIPGTGGCRKLRVAGRGKGKSGGYRVITFYSGAAIPLFLLAIYSKGERADLTEAEKSEMRGMTKELVAAFKPKVALKKR